MNRAILIKSCHENRARFNACDDTWRRALRNAGVPVFVALAGKNDNFMDFWQCIHTGTGDAYADNSQKLRHALRLLLLKTNTEHVFIVDDDTFVHPQRWLAHEPAGDFEGRLYRPTEAQRKQHGPAPWINGGAGWYMSRRMCELYEEHCHERTSGDDIIASRIAQAHGIEIIDRPDLYGDSRYDGAPKVAADNQLITCHPVAPAQMVKLWEATGGL